MKRPFIKVKLHRGLGIAPLGGNQIEVYCECSEKICETTDILSGNYIDELLEWVNTCGIPKGSSNQDFERDSFQLVYLNGAQIEQIKINGYTYPKILDKP